MDAPKCLNLRPNETSPNNLRPNNQEHGDFAGDIQYGPTDVSEGSLC